MSHLKWLILQLRYESNEQLCVFGGGGRGYQVQLSQAAQHHTHPDVKLSPSPDKEIPIECHQQRKPGRVTNAIFHAETVIDVHAQKSTYGKDEFSS